MAGTTRRRLAACIGWRTAINQTATVGQGAKSKACFHAGLSWSTQTLSLSHSDNVLDPAQKAATDKSTARSQARPTAEMPELDGDSPEDIRGVKAVRLIRGLGAEHGGYKDMAPRRSPFPGHKQKQYHFPAPRWIRSAGGPPRRAITPSDAAASMQSIRARQPQQRAAREFQAREPRR